MGKHDIRKVAIYLRKSRNENEEEDALSKHRTMLTDYANRKGWDFQIYEEDILSGERLDNRPKVLELLQDVKNGKFDAILVVKFDRLSRGDEEDFGKIIKILKYTDTYICTPTRIYDVSKDEDYDMLAFEALFSNKEYRTIKGRFKAGKIGGAREGDWVNGKPPYPYIYVKEIVRDNVKKRDRIVGHVEVDEEKRVIYNRIKKMYIEDRLGTERIAITLNLEGVPGPNGKTWSATAVQRLLLHEFHMGKVVFNKYKWFRDIDTGKVKSVMRPEEEWVVGWGSHDRLKTVEEHEKILQICAENNLVPDRSKQGVFPTSGILYCAKCGHRMGYSIGRLEKKTGKQYDKTKCTYKDPYGVKCPQVGCKMTEEFYDALYNAVINTYLNQNDMADERNADSGYEQKAIDSKREEIEKLEKENLELLRLVVKGLASENEADIIRKENQEKIKKLNTEIEQLTKLLVPRLSKDELKVLIENFKSRWDSATNEEKNQLLKTIVRRIDYNRDGDKITLTVHYL